MLTSDTNLLERWQHRGDADAFAELVVRHAGMVFATSRRVLANAAEAEDVAQECFLKLAGHGANVTHPAAWLHQVAVNAARTQLRSDIRRRERETRYATEQPREQAPVASERRELLPLIDEAIAALPESLRIPVILRFLEGRTHEVIAQELGVSRRAVQKRVERGVDRIRNHIERQGVPVRVEALLPWMLLELPAPPAPASLIASLGRHALVSPLPVASKVALLGGTVMVKKIIVAVVAVVVLGLLAVFYVNPPDWTGRWREGTRTGPALADQPPATVAADTVPATADDAAPAMEQVAAQGQSETSGQNGSPREAATSPEEAATLEPPAVLSGTVMNDAAFPVPGAKVYIEPDNSWPGSRFLAQAVSDDAGHYSLEIRDITDSYRVSATASDHRMQTLLLPQLRPGETRDDVDFTLPRTSATLRGRVVTETGQPVSEARVELLLTHGQRPGAIAKYPGRRLAMTVTDSLGQFELGAVREDLCDVCILAKDMAPTVFPGLTPGEEVHELVLTTHTGAIAGSVIDADGSGAGGYRIALQPYFMDGGPGVYDYRTEGRHTFTDAAGAYRFENLSPTLMYHVVVFPPEQQSGRMFDSRPDVRVQPGEVTRVDFSLIERARLFGRITYADGAPAADAFRLRVCEAAPPGLEVGVVEHIAADGAYEMTVGIRSKETTSFRLDAAYQIPGTRHYLDGNYAIAGGPPAIELQPGEEKRLDITLTRGTTLPVLVTRADSSPLAGITVGIGLVLENGQRHPAYPGAGVTDATGHVECSHLNPQDTYYAWAVRSQDNALDPGQAIAESGPVTGRAGEPVETVLLVVEDRGGIEGVLTNDAGVPLANCSVTLSAIGTAGETITSVATSDADGYFVAVRALPPGQYSSITIAALPPDGAPAVTAVVTDIEATADVIVDVGQVMCRVSQ